MAAQVEITSAPAEGATTLSTSLPDLGGALALSDATPQAIDSGTTAGASKQAARADHKHALSASSLAAVVPWLDARVVAKADDATDDLTNLQTCFSRSADVLYSAGTYRIGSTGTLGASGKTHHFARGSKLHVPSGVTLTIHGLIVAAEDQQIFQIDAGGAVSLPDMSDLHVAWLGASPSASAATNAAAIQTALKLLTAGTVHLLGGDYATNATITANSLNGITLKGKGALSRIVATVSGLALDLQSCTRTRVWDLAIAGAHQGGVRIQGGSKVSVSRCDISGNAIAAGGGIIFDGATYCHAEDNEIHDNQYGDIVAAPTNDQSHLTIRGNVCSSTAATCNIQLYNTNWAVITGNDCSGAVTFADPDAGGYGIMVYLTALSEGYAGTNQGHHVIANNTVHDTQGTGIYLQSQDYCTIAANDIDNVASVQTEALLMVGGIAVNHGNATIAGNSITNSGKNGIAVSGNSPPDTFGGASVVGNRIKTSGSNGIRAYKVTDLAIADNTIDTTTGQGIALSDITRGSVRGNVVANPAQIGIFGDSAGTLTDVVVNGNTVYNSGQEGIHMSCPMLGGAITGNQIRNAGGQGLAVYPLSGTATGVIVADNSIVDAGQLADVTYQGIYLRGTTGCTVARNVIRKTLTKKLIYGIIDVSNTNAVFDDNTIDPAACGTEVYTSSGSTNSQGKDRGTTTPAAGTWPIGWRRYNTAPVASGTVGWVNTSTGWKSFGSIAA